MGSRWASEMAEEFLKKAGDIGKGQGVMLAEVVSVEPFSIRLYDKVVTKNLYVNPVYTIGQSTPRLSDAPHPGSWDAFLKEFHEVFTIKPGDQLVVFLNGTSIYVLERVVKKA